jgi:hypothetical protein
MPRRPLPEPVAEVEAPPQMPRRPLPDPTAAQPPKLN